MAEHSDRLKTIADLFVELPQHVTDQDIFDVLVKAYEAGVERGKFIEKKFGEDR